MAYIEEVWIDGLAGRKRPVHLKLNRDVNVFWGTNGSGKTSLLKILHYAMANDAQSLQRVPFRTARVQLYSETYRCSLSRVYSLASEPSQPEPPFGLDEDLEFASVGVSEWLRATSQSPESNWNSTVIRGTASSSQIGKLAHQYLPISRIAEGRSPLNPYVSTRGREAVDDAVFDELFTRQVTRRWQQYNSEALARIRSVQQQGLGEILSILFAGTQISPTKPYESDVIVGDAFELVTDYLKRQRISIKFSRKSFADRYQNQPDLRRIVASIREVMSEIEESERPQKELQRLINDLYRGGKTIDYNSRGIQVTQNGTRVPLESLSSGEKQLLQILLETLSGGPNSVIIDEPELSMHVDWQNRLIESMRTVNPDCQLILATHSPEVMANLSYKHVFEL